MALSNLGLITMGGAMLRPGGSLGDGFLGYGQGLVQDSRMKAQAAQTQAYLQQADMERQQFEAKQRAAKEQQDNWKAFLGTFGPQTPAQASQAPAGSLNGPLGSGTFGIDPLAAMGQKSAPQQGSKWTDMRMLLGLRAGLKREDIEALANANTLGMPEVARTIEQADSMGNPQTAQFDKFGRPVGAAINKPVELDLKDLGGEFQRYNKYTGGLVGNKIPQTVDPNSQLSADTTRRGQNMTDARAREQIDIQRQLLGGGTGKPPAGYRIGKDGLSFEFVPGGPADPAAKTPTEDQSKSAGYAVRMENSLRTIKDIVAKNPGAAKPNLLPSGLQWIGATAAANSLNGEDRQRVEAAQLDALDAALTLGTGAAYTKEQLEGYRIALFPQIGDKSATIKDKAERLSKIIETARLRAGNQNAKVDQVLGPRKPAGATGEWSIRKID